MNRTKGKFALLTTLNSESFIEKAVLLLLTALLSGLIIPFVTNEIQRKKSKTDLILQAQSKLSDDISKTLLTYETLIADVSWYKTPYAYDTMRHRKAFEKYMDRVAELLAEWRIESVKAQNLASPNVSSELDSFQQKMFKFQDSPMNELAVKKGSDLEWLEQHKINTQMLTEANRLVIKLAKDMNITRDDIK